MLPHFYVVFVRDGRIELPTSAWKADVIPLNQSRLLKQTYYSIKNKLVSISFIIMYNLTNALVVKWISQRSSEPLLQVRVLPRAQIYFINLCLRQDSNGDKKTLNGLFRAQPATLSKFRALAKKYT